MYIQDTNALIGNGYRETVRVRAKRTVAYHYSYISPSIHDLVSQIILPIMPLHQYRSTMIKTKNHFRCAASTCRHHDTYHASPDTLLRLWKGYLICNGRINSHQDGNAHLLPTEELKQAPNYSYSRL